jgi:hypothetical protein
MVFALASHSHKDLTVAHFTSIRKIIFPISSWPIFVLFTFAWAHFLVGILRNCCDAEKNQLVFNWDSFQNWFYAKNAPHSRCNWFAAFPFLNLSVESLLIFKILTTYCVRVYVVYWKQRCSLLLFCKKSGRAEENDETFFCYTFDCWFHQTYRIRMHGSAKICSLMCVFVVMGRWKNFSFWWL